MLCYYHSCSSQWCQQRGEGKQGLGSALFLCLIEKSSLSCIQPLSVQWRKRILTGKYDVPFSRLIKLFCVSAPHAPWNCPTYQSSYIPETGEPSLCPGVWEYKSEFSAIQVVAFGPLLLAKWISVNYSVQGFQILRSNSVIEIYTWIEELCNIELCK